MEFGFYSAIKLIGLQWGRYRQFSPKTKNVSKVPALSFCCFRRCVEIFFFLLIYLLTYFLPTRLLTYPFAVRNVAGSMLYVLLGMDPLLWEFVIVMKSYTKYSARQKGRKRKKRVTGRGFLSRRSFSSGLCTGRGLWPSFTTSLSCSQVTIMKFRPVLLTLNLRPDRLAFMIYRTTSIRRQLAASLAVKSLHTSNGLATAATRSLSRCVNNRKAVCNAARLSVSRPVKLRPVDTGDRDEWNCSGWSLMIVCAGNSVDTVQRPLPSNSEIRLSEFQLSRIGLHTTIQWRTRMLQTLKIIFFKFRNFLRTLTR